jgi:hypothetical protein
MDVCYSPVTVGYAVLLVLIDLALIISTLLQRPVPRDLKTHPHIHTYQRDGADRRGPEHDDRSRHADFGAGGGHCALNPDG